jgi:hypothetical protein
MLEQIFCPYCASAQQVVNVHGNTQSVKCGINVSLCCSGEQMTEYEVDDVVSDKKIKNHLEILDTISCSKTYSQTY